MTNETSTGPPSSPPSRCARSAPAASPSGTRSRTTRSSGRPTGPRSVTENWAGRSFTQNSHLITLQFLEDKDWIAENFPTDVRTELALVTAENALLPENIQYVSVQRIKQEIDFTPKLMDILVYSCGRSTTPLRGPLPQKNIQVAAVKSALTKTSASCKLYIIFAIFTLL